MLCTNLTALVLKQSIYIWRYKICVIPDDDVVKLQRVIAKRRMRALEDFQNRITSIDHIADRARTSAEESRKNEVNKAKAKANVIRSTGKMPAICFCFWYLSPIMYYHKVWGTDGDLNICFTVVSIAFSHHLNFETMHVPIKFGKWKSEQWTDTQASSCINYFYSFSCLDFGFAKEKSLPWFECQLIFTKWQINL